MKRHLFIKVYCGVSPKPFLSSPLPAKSGEDFTLDICNQEYRAFFPFDSQPEGFVLRRNNTFKFFILSPIANF
jgi:hypothetical protein